MSVSSFNNGKIVSVIIPFHNREVMLNGLLASIPDHPGIEVITVNDHSVDDVEIHHIYNEASHLRLSCPDGARYAGSARNFGLSHASGKYVFFADSDDLIDAEAFLSAVNSIEELGNPDVLYCHITSFWDGTDLVGTRHVGFEAFRTLAEVSGNKDPLVKLHCPVGKFVRREFIRENLIRFSETEVSNDVLFNLHLCKANGNIRFSEQVVYKIRQGNASLTSVTSVNRIKTRFKIQEEYNDELIGMGKRHLRSAGVVYLLQMTKADLSEAVGLAWRCLIGPTPFLLPIQALRNRKLKRAYMSSMAIK